MMLLSQDASKMAADAMAAVATTIRDMQAPVTASALPLASVVDDSASSVPFLVPQLVAPTPAPASSDLVSTPTSFPIPTSSVATSPAPSPPAPSLAPSSPCAAFPSFPNSSCQDLSSETVAVDCGDDSGDVSTGCIDAIH